MAANQPTQASNRRRGFSLIELLLVLGVLVVVAAVAVPALFEGSDRAQLDQAADQLSQLWGRARLDAVQLGEPLVCQLQVGGANLQVAKLSAAMVGIAATGNAEGEAAVDNSARTLQLEEVSIAAANLAEPAGAESVAYQSGETPAIVFRPDGGASDAEVLLQHSSGLQLKLVLRGLTGAVRAEEVSAE